MQNGMPSVIVTRPPPLSDGPPATLRVARVRPGDSQQADSLPVPDTSETVLSKLPTRKGKRKNVKPTKIVPAVPKVESTLTRGNRVILPPLRRRPLPPGIVFVREASPDSRVNLTRPASPAAQNRFKHTRTLSPLTDTPTPIKHVTAAPKPKGLSPPKHLHAHEDSTHQSMRQLSECSSNGTAPSDRPSTLQPPPR